MLSRTDDVVSLPDSMGYGVAVVQHPRRHQRVRHTDPDPRCIDDTRVLDGGHEAVADAALPPHLDMKR